MPLVKNPCAGSLGWRVMISFSAGSMLNASAGKLSVTRLIHKISIGDSGFPILNMEAIKINSTSPTLADSRNWITFNILS